MHTMKTWCSYELDELCLCWASPPECSAAAVPGALVTSAMEPEPAHSRLARLTARHPSEASTPGFHLSVHEPWSMVMVVSDEQS